MALVDMWNQLTGERPSESLELIESLIEQEEPARKKPKKDDDSFNAGEQLKIDILYKNTKKHMIRYFTVQSPDSLITDVFGEDYKGKEPYKHAIIRKRMLNVVYQTKHSILEYARRYVEAAVQKGGRPIKTSRDEETIREHFNTLYSVENLLAVFFWIEPIIDLGKCPKRVHAFLHSTIIHAHHILLNIQLISTTDAYANLCMFIKFHIEDKNSAKWNRAALILYWDRLGQPKCWDKVKLEHFILKEPKIKKGKSKIGDERNYAPMDVDIRYNVTNTPYELSSDIDHDSG